MKHKNCQTIGHFVGLVFVEIFFASRVSQTNVIILLDVVFVNQKGVVLRDLFYD